MHAKDIVLPKGVALVAHVEAENPVIASATIPAAGVSDAATGGAAATGEGETPAA
jgi:large subunit ribosomal protein L25